MPDDCQTGHKWLAVTREAAEERLAIQFAKLPLLQIAPSEGQR